MACTGSCECGCKTSAVCGPDCTCDCGCTDKEKTSVASRVAAKYLKSTSPLSDFWLDREEIGKICPPCAERMASLNITKIRASAIFGDESLLRTAGITADA